MSKPHDLSQLPQLSRICAQKLINDKATDDEIKDVNGIEIAKILQELIITIDEWDGIPPPPAGKRLERSELELFPQVCDCNPKFHHYVNCWSEICLHLKYKNTEWHCTMLRLRKDSRVLVKKLIAAANTSHTDRKKKGIATQKPAVPEDDWDRIRFNPHVKFTKADSGTVKTLATIMESEGDENSEDADGGN